MYILTPNLKTLSLRGHKNTLFTWQFAYSSLCCSHSLHFKTLLSRKKSSLISYREPRSFKHTGVHGRDSDYVACRHVVSGLAEFRESEPWSCGEALIGVTVHRTSERSTWVGLVLLGLAHSRARILRRTEGPAQNIGCTTNPVKNNAPLLVFPTQ